MYKKSHRTTPVAFLFSSVQTQKKSDKLVQLFRASCRIRTNDPEITNHVLWPTELKRQLICLFLSLLSDSNQRPRDYKSRALAN